MDFIRGYGQDYDNEGFEIRFDEIDLENQTRGYDERRERRNKSRRVEAGSTVSNHSVPLNACVFNSSAFCGKAADSLSTDSETSDSSIDEDVNATKSSKSSVRMVVVSASSILPSLKNLTGWLPTCELPEIDESEDSHCVLFSHGRFWTLVGVVFSWIGLVCAVQARDSTNFVSVRTPIYIDTSFEEVHEIGLLNFVLCLNETHTGMNDCSVHTLDAAEINDRMFQVARSMAFMAIMLGGFMASCLTVSIVWRSINLRPVGVGFLLSYFLQSFTFLFFDNDLCATHGCDASEGTTFSIIASFCWIGACIAAARMDAFKHHQQQLLEYWSGRKARSNGKPSKLNRGISDITKATEASENSASSRRNKSVSSLEEESRFAISCIMQEILEVQEILEETESTTPRPLRTREKKSKRKRRSRSELLAEPRTLHPIRTSDSTERRMRRGRSLSSKHPRPSSGQHKHRGQSIDTPSRRRSRSSNRSCAHVAEASTGSSQGESAGRQAIRAHSVRKTNGGIDKKHYEL